jgi:protein-arginine kinase activator protein McsA
MLCERCQEREAVVHLTLSERGTSNVHHFCERCATDKGAMVSTTEVRPPSAPQSPNEKLKPPAA